MPILPRLAGHPESVMRPLKAMFSGIAMPSVSHENESQGPKKILAELELNKLNLKKSLDF